MTPQIKIWNLIAFVLMMALVLMLITPAFKHRATVVASGLAALPPTNSASAASEILPGPSYSNRFAQTPFSDPTNVPAQEASGSKLDPSPENSFRYSWFNQAELLEERTSSPAADGSWERETLLRTDYKYPYIRVVQKWTHDDQKGQDLILTEDAMVANQLQIKASDSLTQEGVDRLNHSWGAHITGQVPQGNLYLIEWEHPTLATFSHAMNLYQSETSLVVYAEANRVFQQVLDRTPLDPYFNVQWALDNSTNTDINAKEAWDIQMGTNDITVAVMDSGIDYSHEDLQENLWSNPFEIADNQIDDDQNGYIDDCRGWNFSYENNDPMDFLMHGTACAGIIGARGHNAKGIVGVCWKVSLLPLRILDQNNRTDAFASTKAFYYACQAGARIVSCSWGDERFNSASLKSAIEYCGEHNMLIVAAAGNESANIDIAPHYPASFDCENIMAVASVDSNALMATTSSYGPVGVDLAAPGVLIASTQPNNKYSYVSGTSFATPHVAGACALLMAQFPEMTAIEIKNRILAHTTRLPSLKDRCVTEGRLNLYRALTGTDPDAPAAPTHLTMILSTPSVIVLNWKDVSANETGFLLERRVPAGKWDEVATIPADKTFYEDTHVQSATLFEYRLAAINAHGLSAYSDTLVAPIHPEETENDTAESTTLLIPMNESSHFSSQQTLYHLQDHRDWYRCELVEGKKYIFRAQGFGALAMELFSDAQGLHSLTIGEQYALDEQSRLMIKPDQSGIYYLCIQQPEGTLYTSYHLMVDAVENFPPIIRWLTPTKGGLYTIPMERLDFKVQATDEDSGGITQVVFYADGWEFFADDTPPFECAFENVNHDWAGHYEISATAWNAQGEHVEGMPLSLEFNERPMITILTPSPGEVNLTAESLKIMVSAADPNDELHYVQFYINQVLQYVDTTFPYAYVWPQPAQDGSYTISAVAVDSFDEKETASVQVTIRRPLAIPTDSSVKCVAPREAELSWIDQAVNETSFRIQRRDDSGQWITLGFSPASPAKGLVVSYRDSSLDAQQDYTYRVCAINQYEESSYAPPALLLSSGDAWDGLDDSMATTANLLFDFSAHEDVIQTGHSLSVCDEVDCFQVQLTQGHTIQIASQSTGADLQAELFRDPQGTHPLAWADDFDGPNPKDFKLCYRPDADGIYYVKVLSKYELTGPIHYDISVSAIPNYEETQAPPVASLFIRPVHGTALYAPSVLLAAEAAASEGISQVEFYRESERLAVVSEPPFTFKASNLMAGKQRFWIRVFGTNPALFTDTFPIEVELLTPPNLWPPLDFSTSVIGKEAIRLRWTHTGQAAEGWQVERREMIQDQAGEWQRLQIVPSLEATTSPQTFTVEDLNVRYNHLYEYRVRAYHGNDLSEYTDILQASPQRLTHDACDPLDDSALTTTSHLNDSMVQSAHVLSAEDPCDWYTISLTQGVASRMIVSEFANSLGPDAFIMELFSDSAALHLVAFDITSSPSSSNQGLISFKKAQIVYSPPTTGLYYLRVRTLRPQAYGYYEIITAPPRMTIPPIQMLSPTGGFIQGRSPITLKAQVTLGHSLASPYAAFFCDDQFIGWGTRNLRVPGKYQYDYDWANPPAGSHYITAKLLLVDMFISTTQCSSLPAEVVVNAPPQIHWIYPTANSLSVSSVGIIQVLHVEATDPDDEVTNVEVFVDEVLSTNSTKAPYIVFVPMDELGLHTIKAKAHDSRGNSSWSEPIYISSIIQPIAPSTNLIATPQTNARVVQLKWTNRANNESAYRVERQIGTGEWEDLVELKRDTSTYQDVDVHCGTLYTYRVTAINACTESEAVMVSVETPPGDSWDPMDDSGETMNTWNAQSAFHQSAHSLSVWDPEDWYKVHLQAGHLYGFSSSMISTRRGSSLKAHLYRDAGGLQLVSTDSSTSFGYSNQYAPEETGDYYLRIQVLQNGPANYSPLFREIAENAPPTVQFKTPTPFQAFPAGSAIPLEAIAHDPAGSVAQVEFYRMDQLIGTDDTPPYTAHLPGLEPGIYTVKLVAYDTQGAQSQKTISIMTYGDHTDADGDGLNDLQELLLGTQPTQADSDGDLLSDRYEVEALHTDPLDINSGRHLINAHPMISAGGQFSIAAKEDGTVWAWGCGAFGQMGAGMLREANPTPNPIPFPKPIWEVSAKNQHALALAEDGTVFGWGANTHWDLGTGQSGNYYAQPFAYETLYSFMPKLERLAAGSYVNLGLATDQKVWTWGPNWQGQLARGVMGGAQFEPAASPYLSDIVDLQGGAAFGLALTRTGTVWAWGENNYGQLGNGEYSNRSIPTQVAGLDNVIAIAAGPCQAMALRGDGTVWAWGRNHEGQLGDGSKATRAMPVPIQTLKEVRAIAMGNNHSLALTCDGTVWAWGMGRQNGELGVGPYIDSLTPIQIPTLTEIMAISAGAQHSMAVKQDGSIMSWGSDYYGQIGDGLSHHSHSTPTPVKNANGTPFTLSN